jgi:hypothetical protein
MRMLLRRARHDWSTNGVRAIKVETPGDTRPFDLRFAPAICSLRMLPKTACSARGGVLYTQLAKFAALAVQGRVEPETENYERRTANREHLHYG